MAANITLVIDAQSAKALDAVTQLGQRVLKNETAMAQLGQKTKNTNDDISGLSRVAKNLTTDLLGIAGISLSAGALISGLIEIEERLTRIGEKAMDTTAELMKLGAIQPAGLSDERMKMAAAVGAKDSPEAIKTIAPMAAEFQKITGDSDEGFNKALRGADLVYTLEDLGISKEASTDVMQQSMKYGLDEDRAASLVLMARKEAKMEAEDYARIAGKSGTFDSPEMALASTIALSNDPAFANTRQASGAVRGIGSLIDKDTVDIAGWKSMGDQERMQSLFSLRGQDDEQLKQTLGVGDGEIDAVKSLIEHQSEYMAAMEKINNVAPGYVQSEYDRMVAEVPMFAKKEQRDQALGMAEYEQLYGKTGEKGADIALSAAELGQNVVANPDIPEKMKHFPMIGLLNEKNELRAPYRWMAEVVQKYSGFSKEELDAMMTKQEQAANPEVTGTFEKVDRILAPPEPAPAPERPAPRRRRAVVNGQTFVDTENGIDIRLAEKSELERLNKNIEQLNSNLLSEPGRRRFTRQIGQE
jgi:hypothetical protein